MDASVLVFGSDETISRRLAAMLRQEGYAVRYAQSASEFEQAMQIKAPNLLILNAAKNGGALVSVSDLVKAAAAASAAAILVLVPPDHLAEVRRALGDRPAEYYTNPVLHFDLAAKVRAIIGAPGDNGYASSSRASPVDRMKPW